MIITMDPKELQEHARKAAAHGATVEIVGNWAWARFPAKPSETVRQELKSAGWEWSNAKCRWYLKGAISTATRRHSWTEIVNRYGSNPIESELQAA
jgi:hypothetical protein